MVSFLLYSKSKLIWQVPDSPLSKNFAMFFETRDKKMQQRLLSRLYPCLSPVPISVLLKERATSLSMPREPSWPFFSLINMQENNVSFRQTGQQPIKIILAKQHKNNKKHTWKQVFKQSLGIESKLNETLTGKTPKSSIRRGERRKPTFGKYIKLMCLGEAAQQQTQLCHWGLWRTGS